MKKNMGKRDRFLRLGISVLLFGVCFWHFSWIIFALGLFTLFESIFSWCVLFQVLGKSSCPLENNKKRK